MSRNTPSTSTLIVAGSSLYLLYRLAQIGNREKQLPPGPPTVPVLGNLLDFPKSHAEYQFAKWAEQYGDLFSLKIANQTTVVLSSPMAIREILEKNSAVTASRPKFYAGEVITGDLHLPLIRYGGNWRKLRRAAHEILTAKACEQHLPIQQAEGTQLMYDILERPADFAGLIRRYTFSVIYSIVSGKRAPRVDSPDVASIWRISHLFNEAVDPAVYPPVDILPILKLVPERFAPWKTLCREVKELRDGMCFTMISEAEQRIRDKHENGCYMETVIARADEWGLTKDMVRQLAISLVEAAADTTAAFLTSFVLMMVAHPEVQKRAQEEIDKFIDADRAPTVQDIESLPYVAAIIEEVFRMRPPVPILVPKATTADLTYKSYAIPSGSTVIVNCWGIFHDEQYFEDPNSFKPERFLNNKHGLRADVPTEVRDSWPDLLYFGVGRRSCPGIHLARNSATIGVLNMLWAFKFDKATDPVTGKVIEPDLWDYVSGVVACPNPFKCTITPRSDRHVEIIKSQFRDATPTFASFEHGLSEEDRKFIDEQRKAW